MWRPTAGAYLGSVQPLQFLLLSLSPSCLLHTSCQLGTQLLLCVGSGLERGRELLSQLHAGGGWIRWGAGMGLRESLPGSQLGMVGEVGPHTSPQLCVLKSYIPQGTEVSHRPPI